MIKFEYLLISKYINGNNQWVLNYLGKELSTDYLPALFCELGFNGWEMITTSTYIQGDVVNRAIIPIYASTDVGISNTSAEVFYFKRILQDELDYSENFKERIKVIKQISGNYYGVNSKDVNSLNIKMKNIEKEFALELDTIKKLLENNIINQSEYQNRINQIKNDFNIKKEEFTQKVEETIVSNKPINLVKKLQEEAEFNIEKQKKFLNMNLIDKKEYEKEIANIKYTLAIRIKELEAL